MTPRSREPKRVGRPGIRFRRETTLSMYAAGATLDDIMDATGYTTYGAIYVVLRKHGIELERRPRRRKPAPVKTIRRQEQHERHREIARLYETGLSITQLMARFACSDTVITYALDKFDVMRRPRGGYHGRRAA